MPVLEVTLQPGEQVISSQPAAPQAAKGGAIGGIIGGMMRGQ